MLVHHCDAMKKLMYQDMYKKMKPKLKHFSTDTDTDIGNFQKLRIDFHTE